MIALFRGCFLVAAVVLLPVAAFAQAAPDAADKTPVLSPTEAYRYAMQPYLDARSAPNDMTEADQWALGLGVARAHEQCEALAPTKPQGEDLLVLGRLCAFGQDREPAREALIAYLALPKMEDPKSAHLILARVFVGLNWPSSAESQMDSLTSLFPYDADIHWAIDQVIDAAESGGGRLTNTQIKNATKEQQEAFAKTVAASDGQGVVDRLNELQLPFILKALADGGSLKTNDSAVNAAVLVRDGLRCADALRAAGKKKEAADTVEQIKALVAAPAIAQSASKPAIDSAFARYALLGQPAPIEALHGDLVAKPPVPTVKRFAGRTTLVVAFSLGAPQSRDVINSLAKQLDDAKEKKPVQFLAVTSYAATDGEDKPNDAVLETLQALRSTLPTTVPVMIVPESDLQAFAIDTYPAAIVMNPTGKITYLNLLPGTAGSVAQVLRAALE